MSDADQERQEIQRVNIPVEWHIPDQIESRYATNVLVQAGQNEIVISFFETQLPILTGTPEENAARLEQLASIRANCIGRIIVAPDLVPNIISALQTGLNAYRVTKEVK